MGPHIVLDAFSRSHLYLNHLHLIAKITFVIMSQDPITSGRHNDFVGGEGSKGRIPGADDATSGHYFVAVDWEWV